MAEWWQQQRMRSRAWTLRAVGATALSMLIVCVVGAPVAAERIMAPDVGRVIAGRAVAPDSTVVTDEHGAWVATFTMGARTVTLVGPVRTFAEPGVVATVTTTTWVRFLPAPFDGYVDEGWLRAAQVDTSADVLATAMQYVHGAPVLQSSDGSRVAGDAHYGPLQPDGTRVEGADFNDYLGVPWTYGTVVDRPEADQLESLDCSGFVRMVYGFRNGVPLSIDPTGATLPRRSYEILEAGPGVLTIPHTSVRPKSLASLAPGDLVFFDASSDDGTRIDHVGIYLGLDQAGNRRFISSRKSIDGPTLGDFRGRSLLNGGGLYADSFRAARRI